MGYTNNWHQIEDFTDTEFDKLAKHTKKLIKFFEEELEIKFSEVEIKSKSTAVGFAVDTGKWQYSKKFICFNGDNEKDLDHETFIFEQTKREKYDYETDEEYKLKGAFNFCKTNRKPYDALVWNILRKAYQIAPKKISIGNDDGVRFHAL